MRRYLKYIDSRELRIFIASLLIFTLFIHWVGANEWSRYDLTAAMVEDQSLDISNYSKNTIDKAASLDHIQEADVWYENNESFTNMRQKLGLTYNERPDDYADKPPLTWYNQSYATTNIRERKRTARKQVFENLDPEVYTDKPPLSSVLAVPAYMIGNLVDAGKDTWMDEGISSKPVKLSFETSLKQFLIVFTVSALFGALFLVLVYRALGDYVDKQTALYTALIVGFSTPIFTYSSSFFGVINAAFFGFLSYFLMKKSLEGQDKKWMYLAGLSAALAFSTEYYAVLVPIGLITYLLFKRDYQSISSFVGGMFIGAMPLFVYHWFVTGNPLTPVQFSNFFFPGPIEAGCQMYEACFSSEMIGYGGFILEPLRILNNVFRLLFFQTRGLFFYSPVLLLAIPGIYELYKKDKNLLIIFPGIFLLLVFFQAARLNWLGGISFGPRYVVVGVPFLVVPAALGLRKMIDKGRLFQIFVVLAFLFSAFNMLLGFNIIDSPEIDRETYNDRYNSFSSIQPDIYSEMVNNFERYGPRSEVMMSLTDRYKGLDITYRKPYGPEFIEVKDNGNQGTLLSTNLVPVFLLSLTLLIFFHTELGILRFVGLTILVLLILGMFTVSDLYVLGETYRSSEDMYAVNGSMEKVFYAEQEKVAYVEINKRAPVEAIPVSVRLNEGQQINYNVKNKQRVYLFPTSKGRNKVSLKAPYCRMPALEGDSSDTRCLSFGIENLSVVSKEELPDRIYEKGWYKEEFSGTESWHWIRDEATLLFKDNGSKILDISATPYFPISESNLSLSLNGKNVENLTFEETTDHRVALNLKSGFDRLRLESSKGCVKPLEIENNSRDNRCLSFMIENLSTSNKEFNREWYPVENVGGETYRWMKEEAEVIFPSEGNTEVVVEMEPYDYLLDPVVNLSVNNRSIGKIDFNNSDPVKKKFSIDEKGISSLNFQSANGCAIPADKQGDSNDNRCLSFRLNSVRFS